MLNSIRAYWILLKVIYFTLNISITTIYDTYRGKYKREVGDARLRWWSKKVINSAKLSYHAINPSKVTFQPGKPYIIMCNHSSLFDIPLTFLIFSGSIRMMAKKELFNIPIWGKGLRVAEFIPIDRLNLKQAVRDLDYAGKLMANGIILWVAPEGTRSRDGKLLPFKKGGFWLAMKTAATIVPIGIQGAQHVLPSGTWNIKLDQHIEVHIGEPVDASLYKRGNISQLMNDVESQIRKLSTPV